MTRTLAVALAFSTVLAAQRADDPEHLYRSRQWFELRSAVTGRSPALMRAAVATAFNDRDTAGRLLRDIIRSGSRSNAADEAYGMLSQIYRRSGQYQRWLALHRQWVAAIPDSARARAEQGDEQEVTGLPDQINGRPRRSILRHDPGDLTIPASVNGRTDDYLFDTGAMVSVLTERRAARLGLTSDSARRTITGSSGQSTGFRAAIAKEVDIGGTRFRNVSFAVIGTGPFADVDAGIIGMPILLGLRAIRWSPDGAVEIDSPAPDVRADANLVFDGNLLLLRTRVLDRDVLMTLDTGATTTDLNANFAQIFPEAVQGAKPARKDITGVGGTATFDSFEIPQLRFGIGGSETSLQRAAVSLQRIDDIGGACCIGNAGEDLLRHTGFTIDFSAMTLRLDSPKR